MKTRIKIRNCQKKISISEKDIRRLAKQVLRYKGLDNVEVSILFVGGQRMRALNKRYRNSPRDTDVLAFRMGEGKDARLHPEILGDVVICPETASRYAKIYNNTLKREISLDVIHGILHLLGYDDTDQRRRSVMEKEQSMLLEKYEK